MVIFLSHHRWTCQSPLALCAHGLSLQFRDSLWAWAVFLVLVAGVFLVPSATSCIKERPQQKQLLIYFFGVPREPYLDAQRGPCSVTTG